MPKTVALAVVLLFSFLLVLPAFSQTVSAASSDVSACPLISNLEITSPVNATYEVSELMLNVSFRSNVNSIYTYELLCSVDGQESISLPLTSTLVPIEVLRTYPNGTTETAVSQILSYYVISSQIVLPELSQGMHNVTVYGVHQRLLDAPKNWPEILLDHASVNFTVTGTPQVTTAETALPIKQQTEPPNDVFIAFASVLVVGMLSVLAVFYLKKRAEN